MGVATANSILMVSFARERMNEGLTSTAGSAGGRIRSHSPGADDRAGHDHRHGADVAWALGEGGEQNAPLGRAVIGGLIVATFATLFFVPCVFSLVHRRQQPGDALMTAANAANDLRKQMRIVRGEFQR